MPLSVNTSAELYNHDVKKTFSYSSTEILSLDISYPQIRLSWKRPVQKHINIYYYNKANQFYHHASTTLRQGAIKAYHYTKENNYPFMRHEAVMKYTVTMNQDSFLSTYFDQYEFTGGAHGNTLRSSVNWNLQTGAILAMSDLYNPQVILDEIIKLAHLQAKENPYIYFENYEDLIIQYFNEESFYLTPDGISVYYQQYEIGPYASGIIVFDIPIDFP